MRLLKDISEIITGPFGSMLHQSDYVEEGNPIIMPQNIGDRTLNLDGIARINQTDSERLARYQVVENDIVYARRGDVEKHAFIENFHEKLYCGTGCLRVRVRNEVANPQFISFYLNRPETRKWIRLHAVGSNMPNINSDILSRVPVSIPSLKEQGKIALILSSLDKKIAVNNIINDNLQHQLKLIYDYWFTQFDFPDKEGKPYRSSGGAMVWSERLKRNIPAGWRVESFMNNSLSEIIKPGVKHFQSKTYLATADVNGTNISEGSLIDYDTRENRANMQPSIYSVWFAKMKNSVKHLYFNIEMRDIIDNTILSTGFCGLQCSEESFEYISSFIEHSYFETIKDILAHGATQEAVNNDDLNSIALIIPSNLVLKSYHDRVKAIYAKISENICENMKLCHLRDWLLPMLMNGQATIAD